VEWLTTTAAAAEQAAAQSTASAAAYEAAFSGMVPPPLIVANRSTLAALVATNFLGINTPAIMATEAHYAQMWVQDATAMYAYQAGASAAAVLAPLTPASPTTNPAGAGAQAAAVGASANPADAFSDIIAGLQAELANFQTGASSIGTNLFQSLPLPVQQLLTALDGFIGTPLIFNGIQQVGVTAAWMMMNAIPTAVSLQHTLALAAPAAAAEAAAGAEGAAAALASDVAPAGAAASLGEATLVGGLSVPSGWAGAAPATLVSSVAPLEGSGWTVPAEAAGGGPMMAGMPGMASVAKGAGAMAGPRYGFKPTVMPKLNVI
jgi:PPE-repeat protein